mmetsp:Transcript_13642/g.39122  ORF Transcript_13642/g.39122 Transcript_13642/m.39122 type:complete len:140 (-) Transcript_13642:268-687(-)
MVFVAAAAVSAGAYGAYKGGQAAAKGAKQKLNDIKLERNGKAEFNAKSKERAARLSSIEKRHATAGGGSGSVSSSAGSAGWSSASASASAPGAGGSASGKSVEERLAERRSAKAAAAATASGTAGSKKKKGSVLSRFTK